MSKLIGTNPNQVPSNADLGSAAFMDKKELLLSKGSSLSAINAIAPKTAVDLFIYDTSKDSDGGAWRKRTQHTSWYNERLNTTTRGKRKEFPAVAVIVVESATVTIYDGDDPHIPMWMVFTSDNYHFIGPTNRIKTCAEMLNGILCVGKTGSASWMSYISFVDDTARQYSSVASEKRDYLVPILNRNSTTNSSAVINSISAYTIVNDQINDVAMKVLPSAPIDPDTGLPVPTIAVATDGGTSVIKDDGGIPVDITWSNGSTSTLVTFIDNKIFIAHDFSGAVARHGHLFNIPQSDSAEGAYYSKGSAVEFYGPSGFKLAPSTESYVNVTQQAGTAFGYAGYLAKYRGLAFLERNESNYTRSSVANITTDYNTGYMVGDIKLATLSDADGTNAFGSELVTNGTFASNVTGWTTSGGSSVSHQSGQAKVTATSTNIMLTQQLSGLVVGQKYTFSASITPFIGASGAFWGFYLSSGFSDIVKTFSASDQVPTEISATFTATATNNYVSIGGSSGAIVNGEYLLVDNFSVRLAEEDRSVNGKGLQVFGTVTKTAVATGADLAAYSGFSTSNYLKQPYNSDLNFGTGDFSMSVWAKQTPNGSGLAYYIFDKANSNGTNRFAVYYLPDANRLDLYSPTSGQHIVTSSFPSIASWSLITVVRRNSIGYIYHNGNLITSGSFTENLTGDSTAQLSIGTRFNQVEPWSVGGLALFRLSATAPTPEQIKKIYNDEKHLFQENAKTTLYGTSDTVTSLAYDDDTKLLHAGTSAGRSVFQGLRRIDNTTDAVGVAISASNGMVVEE